MAVHSKLLRLCGIFIASIQVLNAAPDESNSTNSPLGLAATDLAEATLKISKKLEFCKSEEAELDFIPLKDLNYPVSEIKTALGYFYMSGHLRCVGSELGRFYVALHGVNTLDKQEKGNDIHKLFSDEQAKFYQYKAAYLQVPLAHRKKLESIPQLQKPFNLISAIKSLRPPAVR